MEALICTVGTEILLGNIVDTNSQYIAQALTNYGINLYKMVTVGDNHDRLYKALKEADGAYDYVFLTGGLGPTADDITKEVVTEVVGKEDDTFIDESSYQKLVEYFDGNAKAIEINKKQALFPRGAIVLENNFGTAPGAMVKSDKGTSFFILPGPPREMKPMFDNEASKYIEKQSLIKNLVVRTDIWGEWDLASRVDLSGTNPTISPYVTDDGPILRISAKGVDEKEVDRLLDQGLDLVKKDLDKHIISIDGSTSAKVLVDLLKEKKERVATAESISGGLIASSIVDIEGASEVLKESYITYSNEVKEKILGVSHETIEKYDVVSEEVAREMLLGLRNITGADLCLATTGYAHLGIAYLGIMYKDKILVKKFKSKGDRNKVRMFIKNRILDLAVVIMRGDYEGNFDI